MSRFHSIVGWFFLVIFLLTGAYLRWTFPEAYESDPSIRYLFRANHVYILFGSLLNIMAARVVVTRTDVWSVRLASAGSILILLSPALFLVAFILETSPASPLRPITVAGAFFALIGIMLLHRASRPASF